MKLVALAMAFTMVPVIALANNCDSYGRCRSTVDMPLRSSHSYSSGGSSWFSLRETTRRERYQPNPRDTYWHRGREYDSYTHPPK